LDVSEGSGGFEQRQSIRDQDIANGLWIDDDDSNISSTNINNKSSHTPKQNRAAISKPTCQHLLNN